MDFPEMRTFCKEAPSKPRLRFSWVGEQQTCGEFPPDGALSFCEESGAGALRGRICSSDLGICFSAFDGGNAGKDFAFDGFEQSTAAGRDVRNLVGHAKLVDASHRITTSDERESSICSGFGNGFCNCA